MQNIIRHWLGLTEKNQFHSSDYTNRVIIHRVGKVSGIEVSGRVSGMPEMPGTKPRFWAPETARNYKS